MSQPYYPSQDPTRPPVQQFPGATQYDPNAPQPNYALPIPGGGFTAAPEHPDTMLVLILGLLSWVTGITGPFAWYFGSRARRQMRENPGRWSASTGLTVGWVLGIISSALVIVSLVVVILGMVFLSVALVTTGR